MILVGEIFDNSDMRQLVDLATNEFKIDISSINFEYTTKIDFILNIINQLQAKINNQVLQDKIKQNQVLSGKELYEQLDESTNQIYVELTQVYYLMRTYLTGETIDFLEEIDGSLRVIHQENWIQALSASKQGYNGNTIFNSIFLLENSIKQASIPLEKAGAFSEITRQSEGVIQDVINAATFEWEVDGTKTGRQANLAKGKIYTDSRKRAHKTIYQKKRRDTNVYAYYSGGRRHQLNLVYNLEEPYNLGHIQERVVAELESYTSVADQLKFVTELKTSTHPVGLVIYNALWNRNNVAGSKEGDLKTLSGQWIQSKRHNEKVISTLQAHNIITEMKTYLLQLKEALNASPQRRERIINNLSDQFYSMFSSDTEKINEKLKIKLRSQLRLMGQPVI